MSPNSTDLDFVTESKSDVFTISVINLPNNGVDLDSKTVSYEDALKKIGEKRSRLLCKHSADKTFF